MLRTIVAMKSKVYLLTLALKAGMETEHRCVNKGRTSARPTLASEAIFASTGGNYLLLEEFQF